MPLPRALPALSALLLIAACSKSDAPPPPPAAPKQQAEVVRPAAPATPTEANVDPALRERLARQEAATRMFDRKPEPARPEPAKPEPARTEPAKTEPAKTDARAEPRAPAKAEAKPEPKVDPRAETRPAEPPKAAPPKLTEPPKVAASKAPEPARPAEPKSDTKPGGTPPPALAAAAPSTAASAAPPRVVSRVDPDFPREAVKAGVDSGVVRARMTVDAAGGVTRVDILEATPRRVFDRAVTQALSQWRFNEGPGGRTVETEVAFRR